jgi:hypothetical protein
MEWRRAAPGRPVRNSDMPRRRPCNVGASRRGSHRHRRRCGRPRCRPAAARTWERGAGGSGAKPPPRWRHTHRRSPGPAGCIPGARQPGPRRGRHQHSSSTPGRTHRRPAHRRRSDSWSRVAAGACEARRTLPASKSVPSPLCAVAGTRGAGAGGSAAERISSGCEWIRERRAEDRNKGAPAEGMESTWPAQAGQGRHDVNGRPGGSSDETNRASLAGASFARGRL